MTTEPIKVLVVDDEPEIRELLARMLAGAEWQTITAENVAAARTHLVEADLDVVVTDLAMPGARGEQLVAEVNTLADPPAVVVITGYPSYESVVDMLRLHAFDYIEKPFDNMEKVRLVVRNAAMSRRLKLENQRLVKELETKNKILARQTENLGERVEDYQVVLQEKIKRLEESRDMISLQQKRLLAILEGFSDGVLVTDPEGRVTLVNRMAQHLLGVQPFEVLGRPLSALSGRSEVCETVWASVSACQDGSSSIRVFRPHGMARSVPVRIRTTTVRDGDQRVGWLTTMCAFAGMAQGPSTSLASRVREEAEQLAAESNGRKVGFELDEQELPEVDDPLPFLQALRQMLVTALTATPPERTAVVILGACQGQVFLEVRDGGLGIRQRFVQPQPVPEASVSSQVQEIPAAAASVQAGE